MKYGIGIDTGGTFTDAVLMDMESGDVISYTKVPTTHHNLREGIEKALSNLYENSGVQSETIEKIGVSSTLATNAIVENKGGDVALFIIGMDKHMELPVAGMKFISGGHDIYGNEVEPLNVEALLDSVLFFKGRVDSYAVISAMSFVNPAHEQVAKKAVSLVDESPVFISSDVSEIPGFEERCATTVLNARLLPVMDKFISGLKESISNYADLGGLEIISGECDGIPFQHAVERSVKTVGSGPASTAFFGASIEENAVVMDIGGTTTDILLVENGSPVLDEGSRIGEFDTHVKSVKMKTMGLGGDSRIGFNYRKELFIGPERVNSICFMEGLPSPDKWQKFPDGDILYYVRDAKADKNGEILASFNEGKYLTMDDIEAFAGAGERTRARVEDLVKKGVLGAAGFTPTDALAVLGKVDAPFRDNAVKSAEILSSVAGMKQEEFASMVIKRFQSSLADAVVEFLVKTSSGRGLREVLPDWRKNKFLEIGFKVRLPIIGCGAAAAYFLPGVADILSARLLLPEYHEVGNAIGAINILRKS